jgi:hypothetical protein
MMSRARQSSTRRVKAKRYTFYDIAALSVTFLLTAKRKVTKRKLSATF